MQRINDFVQKVAPANTCSPIARLSHRWRRPPILKRRRRFCSLIDADVVDDPYSAAQHGFTSRVVLVDWSRNSSWTVQDTIRVSPFRVADYRQARLWYVKTSASFVIIRILPWLFALAFDNNGNLFVSDCGFNSIYKFTPSGIKSTFATGIGWPNGFGICTDARAFCDRSRWDRCGQPARLRLAAATSGVRRRALGHHTSRCLQWQFQLSTDHFAFGFVEKPSFFASARSASALLLSPLRFNAIPRP